MPKTKKSRPAEVPAGHRVIAHSPADWEVHFTTGEGITLRNVWPDSVLPADAVWFMGGTDGGAVFCAPREQVLYMFVPDSDGAVSEKLIPLPEGMTATPAQLAELQDAIIAAEPARVRLLPPGARLLPSGPEMAAFDAARREAAGLPPEDAGGDGPDNGPA